MEVEADERDRQREMEEIEEIRKQIVDTQSEEMDEQVRVIILLQSVNINSDNDGNFTFIQTFIG